MSNWYWTNTRRPKARVALTRLRKQWIGPFDSEAAAVRWAQRNGHPRAKVKP